MSELPRVCVAFDYGLKSIGVAVGQSITCTAQALEALAAENGQPNWAQVDTLIEHWQPQVLLLGLPLHIEGQAQPITHAARGFYKQLEGRYSPSVEWVDERFTTLEAREQIFDQQGVRGLTKSAIDCQAAKLICEQWLRANERR